MPQSSSEPPTLTKDEYLTMANVRKDIWKNSAYGLVFGSLCGGLGHKLVNVANQRQMLGAGLKLSRNTAMMSIFMGGALGSFIMSVTTGKNEVHNLHSIFEHAASHGGHGPASSLSTYQENLQRAQEREADLRTLERRHSVHPFRTRKSDAVPGSSEERVERQRNRLYRRATVHATILEEGRGGLSDAHGGHWVQPSKK